MHTAATAILITSVLLVLCGAGHFFKAWKKMSSLPKLKLFECISPQQQKKRQKAYAESTRLKRRGYICLSAAIVVYLGMLFV